jgi:hypothetical protein
MIFEENIRTGGEESYYKMIASVLLKPSIKKILFYRFLLPFLSL